MKLYRNTDPASWGPLSLYSEWLLIRDSYNWVVINGAWAIPVAVRPKEDNGCIVFEEGVVYEYPNGPTFAHDTRLEFAFYADVPREMQHLHYNRIIDRAAEILTGVKNG